MQRTLEFDVVSDCGVENAFAGSCVYSNTIPVSLDEVESNSPKNTKGVFCLKQSHDSLKKIIVEFTNSSKFTGFKFKFDRKKV